MQRETKYTATYQIGETTVHIVAPDITEEEREKRLEEIKRIIRRIWMELHQE
ncbi:hypothetical protein GCM10007416_07850 [Kroppenstedtia guangzhouensis]|uniref:Uncharacterized protein n=1 Tax=Kroppenstedtia guangzhouensis TaxID=1274356 RepID=A0ABQ1G5G3_9BACL|nr:hypothetical protein [Kroppenstedtia guangzhouensis]GGA37374.1 hypothetical protein GCM10007416_07850 [Kroppenstedtia guangzhouensis]